MLAYVNRRQQATSSAVGRQQLAIRVRSARARRCDRGARSFEFDAAGFLIHKTLRFTASALISERRSPEQPQLSLQEVPGLDKRVPRVRKCRAP
jgi:hypothetical protein